MKNIILIGMAGAGKSTLGVLLAKAQGMDFLDSDIVIQKTDGRKLQEILDMDGMDAFLKIEEDVLCKIDVEHTVIATGGSAVYSQIAMRHLKERGIVVYLDVPFPELQKRLTNIKTRGIAIRPGHTLQDVFDERLALYKKYADITVDCVNMTVEQNVEQIIAALED